MQQDQQLVAAVRQISVVSLISKTVKLRRDGKEYIGLCPFHAEKSPSFGVNDKKGLWHCFGCHAGGDVVEFVKLMYGLSFVDAVKHLADIDLLSPVAIVRQFLPQDDGSTASMLLSARRIWREAGPAGDLVSTYLRSRGLMLPIPTSLRQHDSLWHKASKSRMAGMVAPITVWPSPEVIAIHRTFLMPDGTKAPGKSKMMLAPRGRGSVRLAPAAEVMGVAEGIETALSVQQITGLPMWAGLCTGGVEDMLLPDLPLARKVTIYADNDANGAGEAAAGIAQERWEAEGREVDIWLPLDVDTDWNDVLMGLNHV